MENLTYGDLSIIAIALLLLMKSTDENSEIGRQILEGIAKVDILMLGIRSSMDKEEIPATVQPLFPKGKKKP